MNEIHQGDVLLVPGELPENLKLKESGSRVTLALGETSGHAHVVETDTPTKDKTVFLYEDDQGNMWLEVKSPATLKHITASGEPTLDHNWEPLKQMVYEYIHQSEVVPSLGVRRVAD